MARAIKNISFYQNTMARGLRHHEKKLLKHTDLVGVSVLESHGACSFQQWSLARRRREIAVIRRYHLKNSDEYHRYNVLCGRLTAFAHRIADLPPPDPARARHQAALLSKLYDIGLLASNAAPSDVASRLTVAAFCRRRLPVIMCSLKMAQTVSAVRPFLSLCRLSHLPQATRFIEQGHVRVGPDTITDPAFLVTRHMQDFVTWVDSSKLKRTVLQYNDQLDDFALL